MTNVPQIDSLEPHPAHPDKYSHIEQEHRYLLRHLPPGLTLQSERRSISDRYLSGTAMRLRHVHWPSTGESTWKLTQKMRVSDADPTRVLTTTIYLSEREYSLFLRLEGRELRKDRFAFWHGGRRYVADVFHGVLAGLILAETECSSDEEMATLSPPDFVARDVSHEEMLTGGSLAALTAEEARAMLTRYLNGEWQTVTIVDGPR